MNNGLYEHIEIFVAIAQARSLTGASIATGIGQATISRQLAALEEHLGCRLFLRSTRAISLTERGEVFLQHALRVMDLMSEAQLAVQDGKGKLRGRIRIACTHGFAKKILIPVLPEWQSLHAEIQIELVLSDNLSQLIEERVDVAFRIGALPESSLVARQIGQFNRIVVAAPSYLEKYGVPTTPAQLQKHQCILFSGMEHPELWNFGYAGSEIKVRVVSRLRFSTIDAIYDAVLAGLGIAVMPDWFWTSELLDGRVRRLLPAYTLSSRAISAVTAVRHSPGSKNAVFVSFIEKMLQGRAKLANH